MASSSSLPFASVTVVPAGGGHPARDHASAPPSGALLRLWPARCYLIPTPGPLLLLGAAFDQVSLAPWQVEHAVVYPIVCAAGCAGRQRRYYGRYVVPKIGCAGPSDIEPCGPRALARSFSCHRDPLCWSYSSSHRSSGPPGRAAHAAVRQMLARRYGFDLVGYYLILTAFLLLTSIIVASALAAFLVLDDVDAEHDDGAAGSNPEYSGGGLFRLSCATVVVTTICRRDDVVQRDLEPGRSVFTDSHRTEWPGGLLSAVVTFAADSLRWRTARFRAWRWSVRWAYFHSRAALPTVVSSVQLEHRVRRLTTVLGCPRHFGCASDHGTWWPYLGVAVYNGPSSGCCFAFALYA